MWAAMMSLQGQLTMSSGEMGAVFSLWPQQHLGPGTPGVGSPLGGESGVLGYLNRRFWEPQWCCLPGPSARLLLQ